MDIFGLLEKSLPKLTKERNFSFARHVTIGCGGTAAACVHPRSERELAELLRLLRAHAIPHCFLGLGANVLPRDGYFEGVVIRFSAMDRLSCGRTLIRAEAGVTGAELVRYARSQALGGLEFLAGIPMTVGGATVMNAGVQGRHFSDVVEQVRAVEDGSPRVFSREECKFSEKSSIFQRGIAVSCVLLRGVRSEQAEIDARMREYLARREHLPGGKSFGCAFVNPAGTSAGELIERCGLKGRRVGRARVSEQHANFIINEGTCSEDVTALVGFVKDEVLRKTGILLREEVRTIP